MNENNVQFDMDQKGTSASQAVMNQSQGRGMAGWFVKKGIVKNEANAKNVLVGIVVLDFLAAAILIYFFVLK